MNNKDDYKEEIAIVYNNINNKENLKIFIEIFINNNKDKYKIIYEGKHTFHINSIINISFRYIW